MLSKKQKERKGLTGIQKLINPKTGEEIEVDYDDTPVFTYEEWEKYKIGQPGMKPFSEITEEEYKRVFTDIWDEEK